MNIEEYREMKAQMEQEDASTQPQQEVEPTLPEPEAPIEPEVQMFDIDGKQVSIDELKSGYLRQSDYTRKTQELRRKERDAQQALKTLEQLQSDPYVAKAFADEFNIPTLNPEVRAVREMQDKYYDLLIETQFREMHEKYGDFDEQEVIDVAIQGKIEDLDMAYHVSKARKGGGSQESDQSFAQLNADELRKQIREEVLRELRASADTSSVIDSRGATQVRSNEPQLSPDEARVARAMGMDVTEYARWRDVGKK